MVALVLFWAEKLVDSAAYISYLQLRANKQGLPSIKVAKILRVENLDKQSKFFSPLIDEAHRLRFSSAGFFNQW